MAISVGQHGNKMSDPNVVPLIDVLLVLIIIFMAITPTTPTGLRALVPQPPLKNALAPDGTIVVQVSSDGKVMVNQTPLAWNELGPRLTDVFKTRADKTAFVRGEDDTSFGYVEHAVDIMRGSGVTNVGLMTAKMEAGQ